jgi:hypothetical protein
VLQPREGENLAYENWAPEEAKLRDILRQAAAQLPFTEAQKVKYLASATHQEILAGALNPAPGVIDPEEHVFAYLRTIKGLPENKTGKDYIGLSGNALVVIGSGDPLLGDEKTDTKYGREPGWIFKDIANALKSKGIGTIEGIIVDSSVFDNDPVHPSWPAEELNKWYACEVSGLNFNDNCVRVSAKKYPHRTAIVFGQKKIAYKALDDLTDQVAVGLLSTGIKKQDDSKVILFHLLNSYETSLPHLQYTRMWEDLIAPLQGLAIQPHPLLIDHAACFALTGH